MAKDWSKIYKKYKGLWVALLEDEETVVGSGKTVREAMMQAEKKGYSSPILSRVPNNLNVYVG
ncbi:MAG: hypothetical protein KBC35_04185 [Candidatus Pacebacteria bacterium]|nr:hypothetical protein [Candidatus Paceibacterota bacterium]